MKNVYNKNNWSKTWVLSLCGAYPLSEKVETPVDHHLLTVFHRPLPTKKLWQIILLRGERQVFGIYSGSNNYLIFVGLPT